ncbi:MAG: asparaginase [Thermoflexales bacterium]|nr:asparaginase [Thermoflexales bacterium]
MSFGTETLVEVWRGGRVESEHRGAIAVVDANGRILAYSGDVLVTSYLRSSAKPFQLLPLIESGAADRLGFTDQELAVIAGSHSGEPRHLEAVQSILNKIGIGDEALQCGLHAPFSPEAAKALRAANQNASVLHNNCSGKHAGMLAQAVDRGLSTTDYLDPQHPVQIGIRHRLAQLADLAFDDIGVGVDGCSAPCFALPLKNAALAFARLAQSKDVALARVAQVMIEYPEMVAGEGRLDTDLMRATAGRLFSKGGAEGFHGIGVLAQSEQPAYGIAWKIGDGDGKRGGHPAVIEALRQLGLLDEAALTALKSYHTWPITNHRGLAVGEVKANFTLSRV